MRVLWGSVVFLGVILISGLVPTALGGGLAVVFIVGLVLLAYFTRGRSRHGALRRGGVMDQMPHIGAADGTAGGSGHEGWSSHIIRAHSEALGAHHSGVHGDWGGASGGGDWGGASGGDFGGGGGGW